MGMVTLPKGLLRFLNLTAKRLPLLSVIIPHYNEKSSIEMLVRKVVQVPIEKEIIFVDDGSDPETICFLRDRVEGKYPDLKIIYHQKNQGKGADRKSVV